MTKFGRAVHDWMTAEKKRTATSNEIWATLERLDPELTAKTETRKTPRTTMMRDLRKDGRFEVADGRVSLLKR